LGASSSLAEIGGPTLAGILVSLVTAPLAILFDAISFLISALCMSLIRTPKQVLSKTEAQQHIWHDIITGLRVVIDDPILRVLALSGGIFEFFGNFIGTLYILYIVRILHANPLIVGFLVATGGASALIGAFVAERVVRKFRLGRTIGWALFGYGFTGLLTPLAQGPTFIALSMLFAAQFLGDIMIEIYLIGEISLRQSIIPSHLLGRANASIQFFTRGVGPIGALIAGFVIVPLIGIRIAILIGVLGVILAGLCILVSPVRNIEKRLD
jgi:Na+/melibiose symporter-like transporter